MVWRPESGVLFESPAGRQLIRKNQVRGRDQRLLLAATLRCCGCCDVPHAPRSPSLIVCPPAHASHPPTPLFRPPTSQVHHDPASAPPFGVDSAFGGLALYKLSAVLGCRYDSGPHDDCEHVAFHRSEAARELFPGRFLYALRAGFALCGNAAPLLVLLLRVRAKRRPPIARCMARNLGVIGGGESEYGSGPPVFPMGLAPRMVRSAFTQLAAVALWHVGICKQDTLALLSFFLFFPLPHFMSIGLLRW